MTDRQKNILKFMMKNNNSKLFEYFYEDRDGINLIYYYGIENKISIPKIFDKKKIISLDAACFNSNKQIIKIIIPDGIEAIY